MVLNGLGVDWFVKKKLINHNLTPVESFIISFVLTRDLIELKQFISRRAWFPRVGTQS